MQRLLTTIVLAAAAGACTESPAPAKAALADPPGTIDHRRPPPPQPPWDYYRNPDPMGNGTIERAVSVSVNTITLAFPYEGQQHGELTLRKHPRWGQDVFVSVERGQMLCEPRTCMLTVRFDDAPPVRFTARAPADHQPTILFITNTKAFIARARQSRRVAIEVIFFEQGARHLEFSIAGLRW